MGVAIGDSFRSRYLLSSDGEPLAFAGGVSCILCNWINILRSSDRVHVCRLNPAVVGTLKLKFLRGKEVLWPTESPRGSSEEHQKSRESGKAKPNFKTFAEENAERSGNKSQKQTITTLSVKSETSSERVI